MTLAIALGALVIVATIALVFALLAAFFWRESRRYRAERDGARDAADIAREVAQQITDEHLDDHAADAERVVHGLSVQERAALSLIENELSDDHSLMRMARRYDRKTRRST